MSGMDGLASLTAAIGADFGDRWITAPGALAHYRPLEGPHPADAPKSLPSL
jgi:hypothetical protein